MENIKKNQVTTDDVEYAFEDMKPEQQAMIIALQADVQALKATPLPAENT